jgi:hypothetical protein
MNDGPLSSSPTVELCPNKRRIASPGDLLKDLGDADGVVSELAVFSDFNYVKFEPNSRSRDGVRGSRFRPWPRSVTAMLGRMAESASTAGVVKSRARMR